MLNYQQNQNRREAASSNNTTSPSIIDSEAVSEKVNEWIGSFSAWTSSVQKTVENTLTSLHKDSGTNNTTPKKKNTSTNSRGNLLSTSSATIVPQEQAPPSSSSVDFVDVDLSSSNNKNNTLKKSQTLTSNNAIINTPPTSCTDTNKMMEKRSLIRNQDFSSSGEEDEESLIGSLKKLKPSGNSGSWFDSFQNIKSQLFSENNKTEEDDGPLAKSFSSKTSTTPKSPSPVTSQNNLLDSLSSTFSSFKTQTNDKWSSLTSQFFETQPPIDENDNSFIGRLSKDFDGMITLSAKQRMYGFFMALGFGLLCILIALGFLPSILFASGAFAFFYTFGNLLCLTSTLFLVGPTSQLKNMSKPERAIPSLLFVGSMFLTLLCVFFMPLAIFIIILVVVQTVSLAWYVISYIPFAQSILGMVFSSFMKLFN